MMDMPNKLFRHRVNKLSWLSKTFSSKTLLQTGEASIYISINGQNSCSLIL